MDHIEPIAALITFVGEWKSMLLPELAGFANFAVTATKFQEPENNVLHLHFTKPREFEMVEPLVP